jgi:hypothetical protein
MYYPAVLKIGCGASILIIPSSALLSQNPPGIEKPLEVGLSWLSHVFADVFSLGF